MEFAAEKGTSSWLTVIPISEMNFNLNKREFRDALNLRYDWNISDSPSMCVYGEMFTIDHAMICKHRGFIIQRHNELRDLEAELLNMVCNDVEIEPALQNVNGETLNPGANTVHLLARGWMFMQGAFGKDKDLPFLMSGRVCHPNAESYEDLTPQQIYRKHENEKKHMYGKSVTEIEQGTFTPLVFTTTGGIWERNV